MKIYSRIGIAFALSVVVAGYGAERAEKLWHVGADRANTAENSYWKGLLKSLMNMSDGFAFVEYPSRLESFKANIAWRRTIWKMGRKFHASFPANPMWKEWFLTLEPTSPAGVRYGVEVTEEMLQQAADTWARTPRAKRYDRPSIPLDDVAIAEDLRIYQALRTEFLATATPEEMAILKINELAPRVWAFLNAKGPVDKVLREGASKEEAAAARAEFDDHIRKVRRDIVDIAALDVDWSEVRKHGRPQERQLETFFNLTAGAPSSLPGYVQGNPDEISFFKELQATATSGLLREKATGRLLQSELKARPLEMKFAAIDGRQVDLTLLRGKVVLLQYWATNCVSCVQEIPGLKSLYEKYHDAGFEIVGVSQDSDPDVVKGFVATNQMSWPQRVDREATSAEISRFGFSAVSNFLLLDKEGRLLLFTDYTSGGATKMEALIREQLKLDGKTS